ncbi:pyridoxamine 5'-phosphate oxidase family protein [Arenibacterium sp. CAU 1754]
MSDTPTTLPRVHTHLWTLLTKAAQSAPPADRFVTLATVDARTVPHLRTVALRRADQDAGQVDVFTDSLSCKINELNANPNAGILFWEPVTRTQLRLSGGVEILTGPAVRPIWDALPEEQHENYSHLPPPGQPIEAHDAYAQQPSPDRFAILRLTLDHIDYVCLAPDIHRRAAFVRTDDWQGQWLSP